MLDVWLSRAGQTVRYVLGDDRLSINERVIELASIVRVRLFQLGDMQGCELLDKAGKPASIVNDARDKREGYAELVRTLHARLADVPGIVFTRGAWLLVGINIAIGVLVLVVALALAQRRLTPPAALEGKALLVMQLAVVWLSVGAPLVRSPRPRSYYPRAVPNCL